MRSSSVKAVSFAAPLYIDVEGAQCHATARLNRERGFPAAILVRRFELRGNDGFIVAERLQTLADLLGGTLDPALQLPVGRVSGLLIKRQPGQQVFVHLAADTLEGDLALVDHG